MEHAMIVRMAAMCLQGAKRSCATAAGAKCALPSYNCRREKCCKAVPRRKNSSRISIPATMTANEKAAVFTGLLDEPKGAFSSSGRVESTMRHAVKASTVDARAQCQYLPLFLRKLLTAHGADVDALGHA